MEAHVAKAGKARYIGGSNMYGWQFAKAIYTSRIHGWTGFVDMQDHLGLINREKEREMLPLCLDQGIAVMPLSPMARSRLIPARNESSNRLETDEFGKTLYNDFPDSDGLVIEAVGKVASARVVASGGGRAGPGCCGKRA
jgi:1-deoxyxylulose-5-phosphate synthase